MTAGPRDLMALNALSRFGLGPRRGDLRRVAGDPRGAVHAELMKRNVALLPDPYLKPTERHARLFLERKVIKRTSEGRELQGRRRVLAEMMRAEGRLPPEAPKRASKTTAGDDETMDGAGMASREMAPRDMAPREMGASESGRGGKARGDRAQMPEVAPKPMTDEVDARLVRAIACDIGFVERWVSFWSNHLTVSPRSGYVRWIVGAYEREAIRPHALGRFSDLLLAATRHPAMLIALDNELSNGPNSRVGSKNGKGLNENHAREMLELHTVGVDGGYTQADVTSLAKALTGWRTVRKPRSDKFGGYEFDEDAHEPGPQTVMGKVYADDGVAQGEAILADLARMPATARHVARRLAIAFVSDEPPPGLVDRLATTFMDTDGDLKQLALSLIGADEAWLAPRAKMRSAQEFVFATARALGDSDAKFAIKGLKALGQPIWGAPSPKGYSIYGRDWIAPDAQTNRLDLAVDLAQQQGSGSDPNGLALDLLGDVMSDETKSAVKRAGSREQALALLLMSPEMQRR